MSFCCFPGFQSSSRKRHRNQSLFRSWFPPHCGCFKLMFRRSRQSSVQIISTPCGNSVSINPEQEHENSNSGQCWSRVQVSTQGSVQGNIESTLKEAVTCRAQTLQSEQWEKLVGFLVPSSLIRPISYFTNFLCSSWDFDIVPYSVHKLFGSTISSMFENWPEWYHPPYIPKLTVSEVCMQAKSRGAHLEPALTDAPAPCHPRHEPALQTEPAVESKPLLERAEQQKPAVEPSCLSSEMEDGSMQEVLLALSPKKVAQQLTRMDAELFKKVVPCDCLGSIWTQRNKKGNEHLAPTVRATIAQFNQVANCVITTCLGVPGMRATDRAKTVEHWIKVARECLKLRNFSSLHAIISALQTAPIHRLSETWGEVSRKTSKLFTDLCTKDTAENRNLLLKVGLSKKATLETNPQRAQMRQWKKKKGLVPFLGTFLTDLVMLDTAMEEYVDDNLMNFEKKKKEMTVLQEIQLCQVAARKYNFKPKENFQNWFNSKKWLTDNESYKVSLLREPRSKHASNTLTAKKQS